MMKELEGIPLGDQLAFHFAILHEVVVSIGRSGPDQMLPKFCVADLFPRLTFIASIELDAFCSLFRRPPLGYHSLGVFINPRGSSPCPIQMVCWRDYRDGHISWHFSSAAALAAGGA